MPTNPNQINTPVVAGSEQVVTQFADQVTELAQTIIGATDADRPDFVKVLGQGMLKAGVSVDTALRDEDPGEAPERLSKYTTDPALTREQVLARYAGIRRMRFREDLIVRRYLQQFSSIEQRREH